MVVPRKQLKITKLFKKSGTVINKNQEDDCEELQEEIRQLEERLKQKQNKLFQIQRNQYRTKLPSPKNKKDNFVRPRKIILQNSVDSLKQKLQLMAMLNGTEVQSYVSGEHCCVVFHMQHSTPHQVSHGLKIDMQSGRNEVTACSMPLGFNLEAVMEDFDNVMKPECLSSIRKALVAYYDRLEQFSKLKRLVNVGAELFKTLDGSHIEISVNLRERDDEDEQFPLVLMLDYRVYDIRPKTYSFKEIDLSEGVADTIREQCAILKKKELHRAFKEAFLGDIGPYRMVQQVGIRGAARRAAAAAARRRARPNQQRYNDDTFLPEDCSDQGEDEDEVAG